LGTWSGRATGADGQFQFSAGKPVTLLFVKDGFRPDLRAIAYPEDIGDVSVVLEPEGRAALNLPLCGRHGSIPLRELEPGPARGISLRHSSGGDYIRYHASYIYRGSEVYFESMTGIYAGGLTPTPEWAAGLSSFTVRSLSFGGDQWFDLRGTTQQGLQSRWVGYAGTHVAYSKIPAPVARLFDKAIDNECCR
jgi:hypothetical protein